MGGGPPAAQKGHPEIPAPLGEVSCRAAETLHLGPSSPKPPQLNGTGLAHELNRDDLQGRDAKGP